MNTIINKEPDDQPLHTLAMMWIKLNKLFPYIIPFLIMHLLFAANPIFGANDVKVRAYVNDDHTTISSTIQLHVTIEGGQGDVDTSAIKDFKVIPNGSSSSVKIINNDVHTAIRYNFTLIPLKNGRFIIPSLPVRVDERVFKTDEIQIMVSEKPAARKTGGQKIFAKAMASDTSPYIGQQFTYTFQLYQGIPIENPKFQKPKFETFTAEPIGDQKTYQTVVSGKRYHVVELAWVLIPNKSGVQEIDPSILHYSVAVSNRAKRMSPFESFFNDPFFNRGKLKPGVLQTESVRIDVKPLPEYMGKDSFSGLVGDFTIRTQLGNQEVAVGDSTTLSVTIQGKGNIMDAGKPKMHLPKSFKIYQDNPEEKISLKTDGYHGKKIYRMALVAMKPGEYRIPSLELNYFDLKSKRYRIKRSKVKILNVVNSVEPDEEEFKVHTASPLTENKKEFKKRKVKFLGKDILPVKNDLKAIEHQKELTLPWFWVYLLIPVCLYVICRMVVSYMAKDADASFLMYQRAEGLLKKALNPQTPDEVFLLHLYRAFISMILAKAGTMGESLTSAEARRMLLENGCKETVSDNAARLLEKIEQIKYSGASINKKTKKDLIVSMKDLKKELS